MPYQIKKRDGKYCVVNTATGKVKAKHTSLAKARAQVRLLHGIEHGSIKRK